VRLGSAYALATRYLWAAASPSSSSCYRVPAQGHRCGQRLSAKSGTAIFSNLLTFVIMTGIPGEQHTPVIRRLQSAEPLVTVELRPPRSGMSFADSMDRWIDMYHGIQRLTRQDTLVFLTDNAVGQSEEENLNHITSNLGGDISRSRIIPFLTCKHTLDYCHLYAQRAASYGFEALTVLGGDNSVGPPRCVPHAYQLRQSIRERIPNLALGGWANPHKDPVPQVEYLTRDDFAADFYLTQVVSHHSAHQVEAFLNEARRRDVALPGVFGVFLYRSANPRTLERLNDFFPVPAREITREFEAGATPEEICVRSITALRSAGVDKIYVSNLGFERIDNRYRGIMSALASLPSRPGS